MVEPARANATTEGDGNRRRTTIASMFCRAATNHGDAAFIDANEFHLLHLLMLAMERCPEPGEDLASVFHEQGMHGKTTETPADIGRSEGPIHDLELIIRPGVE